MNMESKHTPLVALTLTAAMLSGCSSETTPTPIDTTTQKTDLVFESEPHSNFNIASCAKDTNGWAVDIDSSPMDANGLDRTVGLTETYNEEGYPNSVSGAKIRSLGGLAYEIVTSDDVLGQTTSINLGEKPFTTVLEGGDGYDVVLSARLGDDGSAYFGANCLPEFDYRGENQLEVPLVPQLPVEPPVEIA
jgi:hypothetical protein